MKDKNPAPNFMKSHLYFLKLSLSGMLLTVYCWPGLTVLGLEAQMQNTIAETYWKTKHTKVS